MFQEDAQMIAAAEKASEIPSGEYEAVITGASIQKPREAGKHGSIVTTWAISTGEYEGCEYTQYLTLSPNAAGVRAAWYRNIGYVRPADGTIDENDFIGCRGKVVLANLDGSVKVTRVLKSEVAAEGAEAPATSEDFGI